jgi:hypothetical protein
MGTRQAQLCLRVLELDVFLSYRAESASSPLLRSQLTTRRDKSYNSADGYHYTPTTTTISSQPHRPNNPLHNFSPSRSMSSPPRSSSHAPAANVPVNQTPHPSAPSKTSSRKTPADPEPKVPSPLLTSKAPHPSTAPRLLATLAWELTIHTSLASPVDPQNARRLQAKR